MERIVLMALITIQIVGMLALVGQIGKPRPMLVGSTAVGALTVAGLFLAGLIFVLLSSY